MNPTTISDFFSVASNVCPKGEITNFNGKMVRNYFVSIENSAYSYVILKLLPYGIKYNAFGDNVYSLVGEKKDFDLPLKVFVMEFKVICDYVTLNVQVRFTAMDLLNFVTLDKIDEIHLMGESVARKHFSNTYFDFGNAKFVFIGYDVQEFSHAKPEFEILDVCPRN